MGIEHPYLVFSQEPKGLPDSAKLSANAIRFFGSTLTALEEGDSWLLVRVMTARPLLEGEFRIDVRETTQEDLGHARDAEARGRAGGMAALAAKCASIWEIGAGRSDPPSEAASLTLCAICASVALGPIMPADQSTLFGVRGAMERRDRAIP